MVSGLVKGDALDLIAGSEVVRLPRIHITGDLAVAIDVGLRRTAVGLLHAMEPTREISMADVEIVQVPDEKPQILRSLFGDTPLRYRRDFGSTFRVAWDFAIDDQTSGAMVLSFYDGLNFVAFIRVPHTI